ncbi:SDR family NAD(P)-dependent oxidoreductase [Pseudonocardia benzenivorans]|jgi:NAD(P)-dependent dehydrogenase (short-subunit alcohol dehydrogenase family)|uniref:3-oxoacyl-(Acyl-carrier-protein) reductase n=2 Tax=Pseudonocardia TaxID=1847 RepID=F4CT72_PSEUX|nr:SDR family NAD(P)-dependent oxidoreductase [Pseudonocardia dioxanivorans]AEA26290.1 3-oxoacyl-(acyl-carrier-protein) reductase [Pseudonocardia dioxanivorans CB1190]GJF03236.1 3-oxoacyl-ACP reductase [Pseudonocardia sp. D17]
MGALDGKVAVITGGASGIGRATAVRFAAEGADVVIGDLAPGDDAVAEVEKAGGRAVYLRTDTTSEDDCEALVAAAVDRFGRVDVGVASAGIATAAGPSNVQTRAGDAANATHVVNLATETFERVLDVNVVGVMQTDRALARRMVAQGSGSIVNIASSAARIPLAGAAPYCVSKAGVWMLTKVLGLELATTGVRVNAVGPGYTATPMIDGIEQQPAAFASAMSITPMNRLGRPEEIAAACLFLATDESSFMTGQMLHPAGGQFTG